MSAPAMTSPATPTPANRRSPGRRILNALAVLALLVATVTLLALSAQRPPTPLEPDSTQPLGAKGLVEVLRDHGVDVQVVRSIDDLEAARLAGGASVVVGNPANLGPAAIERLRVATRFSQHLVLLGARSDHVRGLGLPVTTFATLGEVELEAGCSTDAVRLDDRVDGFSTRYLGAPASGPDAVDWAASGDLTPCFGIPDSEAGEGQTVPADTAAGAAMITVSATSAHAQTTVVGFPEALTNATITTASHAGIAVRLLGQSPYLIWYQPGEGDLTVGTAGVPDDSVWPRWLGPVTALLAVVIALLAVARGRRLGPLVSEPLPVVVRPVETTESRAELYRRAADRERAAVILRAGTSRRLRSRLGVSPTAPLATLAGVLAATSGRPLEDVSALLGGPSPATDAQLTALAAALSDLEERVRHA